MTEQELQDYAKRVASKADFLKFLDQVTADGRCEAMPWENDTAVAFVEGFRGYLGDTRDAPDTESLTWSRLANVLLAARLYE